ncbi:MAG: GAF domain-containing protein [Campylobacterota bacterium]|nr:GAF domain-containing protein [Campylobacterota bacterium]
MKTSIKPDISPDIRVKWQRIVDLLIKEMDVKAAFIMQVEDDRMTVVVSSKIENTPYVSGHQFFLKNSFSEEVVNNKEYFVVDDASIDPKWKESTAIKAGFNYFQGYPICWGDGEVYGTISVMDHNNNYNATNKKGLLEEFKIEVEQDLLLLEKEVEISIEKEKRKIVEDELKNFTPKEFISLWEGAKAVLEYKRFDEAARVIFDEACKMTGAKAGYVALLSKDGSKNEVVFLEAGGMPCTVDPNLPMPIRGLRADSYQSHKAVFENDFMNSKWIEFMPEGHVVLKNVMFAPLNVEGQTVGIMGLANKEEDFTEFDSTIAEAFGDLCTVALTNSRRFDEINETNEKLESFNKSLVERELRIIEIKQEVNSLCKELGKEPRYIESK